MENSMSLSKENILLVANIIAEELPAKIDGRHSPAHKRMYELYQQYKSRHYCSVSFDEAAHFARREWIRELLTNHLGGEP